MGGRSIATSRQHSVLRLPFLRDSVIAWKPDHWEKRVCGASQDMGSAQPILFRGPTDIKHIQQAVFHDNSPPQLHRHCSTA